MTSFCACLCVCSLVGMAAKSIQQELQHRKNQADAWNNSAIDLVKASDVSLVVCLSVHHFNLEAVQVYNAKS